MRAPSVRRHTDGNGSYPGFYYKRRFIAGIAIYRNVLAQETVVFVHYYLVALADGGFQLFTVEHSNSAADIFDQTLFLQVPRRDRHTLAADAEHVGNEIVRHYELVRFQLIVVYEQPTAKLLFDGMQAVTDSCLSDLCHKRLRVTQKYFLKNAA